MPDHASRPGIYYAVFAALILLTLLTVGVSFADLGPWHTMVGIAIGVVKALLVALFFMHLLHADRITWLAASVGLFWLGILLGLTLTDYFTRHLGSY
jgi:cytochrome c oxidase subunit 4